MHASWRAWSASTHRSDSTVTSKSWSMAWTAVFRTTRPVATPHMSSVVWCAETQLARPVVVNCVEIELVNMGSHAIATLARAPPACRRPEWKPRDAIDARSRSSEAVDAAAAPTRFLGGPHDRTGQISGWPGWKATRTCARFCRGLRFVDARNEGVALAVVHK